MKNLFIYLSIFFIHINGICQHLYYEDIFQGGVTASGTSSGIYHGPFSSSITLNIPSSSTIKKAFLIFYNGNNDSTKFNFILNGDIYNVNKEDYICEYSISNNPLIISTKIHVIDVTSSINSSQNIYSLEVPVQQSSIYSSYSSYYLVVMYENPTGNTIDCSIILNDQDLIPQTSIYPISILNPIDYNADVGFAIHSDILWDNTNDGTLVYINNNLLGIIGGSDLCDNMYIGAGVKGSFYYHNSLGGLDDDTPDNVMNGSDGLAIINPFIAGNNFFVNLTTQLFYNHYNNYVSFHLAYSTPCQPFNVSVSNDTVVCPGEPVQLHASGGVQYEWLPHKNLSCYNCANPVFTGDSSQFYSVRIWNNDSCSVVRPVMVRVRPKPTFSNLSSSSSVCGGSTGSIVGISPNASHYSLDNITWQTSGSFSNLQAGNYTVYVTDTNGCVGDSTLSVTEQTTVHAQFTATPSTGTVPLSVVLSNQSSNYTNLEWFVDGVSQGASFSQFLAGQSGVYDIELVAWQNNSTCADTFSLQISAYDSLLISIPNIVTPNQDGINDQFSIQCNQPLNITYSILNRWGNVLSAGTRNKQQGNVVLWNIPNEITDGVYFYKITFSSENPQIQQQ
ncbi:MAG TPA: gliding motility-associated C-terminal domain-containing protein, partial [Fluviicola sp.]|nr:gliding motility-associated C-terminal domain-containing protein [Fluviicola sp.]